MPAPPLIKTHEHLVSVALNWSEIVQNTYAPAEHNRLSATGLIAQAAKLTLARMSRFDERALWLARHVLPHEPALRAWLARRPITGLDIDDIVQETYAKLSGAEDVSTIANVRSYVFTAAYSVMASHLRRSQIVSIHSYASLEEFSFLDPGADPEETLLARDELQRLGEAIAKMPPRVRQVLTLRRIEGLSQREVAAHLGISESTVEKQLADSMLRLSDAFARGGKRKVRASRAREDVERSNDATRD